MNEKRPVIRIQDLMLTLEEYPVVDEESTLLEALQQLESAQAKIPAGQQPHRAVLVADHHGKIIGKIGHLAFMKALEQNVPFQKSLNGLLEAGVSDDEVDSLIQNIQFWDEDFTRMCQRIRSISVRAVMRPVKENVDENASIMEAVRQFNRLQTLSLLVTRNGAVVGILRLSDVFDAISKSILDSTE